MNDFKRIERHIREAHLQRSMEIGVAIGEFLANAWVGIAGLGDKASEALGRRPAPAGKTAASH